MSQFCLFVSFVFCWLYKNVKHTVNCLTSLYRKMHFDKNHGNSLDNNSFDKVEKLLKRIGFFILVS